MARLVKTLYMLVSVEKHRRFWSNAGAVPPGGISRGSAGRVGAFEARGDEKVLAFDRRDPDKVNKHLFLLRKEITSDPTPRGGGSRGVKQPPINNSLRCSKRAPR